MTLSVPLAALAQTASEQLTESRRTAVVRAVERVEPAVVSVQVTYREDPYRRLSGRDPLFELLFPFAAPERERVSTGSGVIVSRDGFVLTNRHVVGSPERLTRVVLSLPDGRSVKARHVASDYSSDLAVLKVETPGLPVAPLADSGDILVGEWAIAIGNPFGLGPSVSIGVVSALDRDFPEPQGDIHYRDMIQTDAAINPGNSGGPLVNALGQVIGINSFIYTGSEYSIGSIGIGFAIPINAARTFLDEVRTHGQVRRAWTGVRSVQDIPAWAEVPGAAGHQGAIIVQVAANSPAGRAGLRGGDLIVAINDEKVRSADEAVGILNSFRVDQDVRLTIVRDGDTLTLRLRSEEFPEARSSW
ncbi:MAG: trypsin-like peptidase domain-containing protein [Candidatus Latescibacterota bacterium]